MPVQTSILAAGQPIGFAGLCTYKLDSKSASNAEASTNIGFGLGVKPGTKDSEALLPTAVGSVLFGIVLNNPGVYSPGDFGSIDQAGSPPGLIPDTMMEIITKGRVWARVDADATITPNVSRAYWRWRSDGASNTLLGTFRADDPGGGHVVDVRGQVIFRSSKFLAADGTSYIAEVEISSEASPT